MNSNKDTIRGLETVLTHFYPNEANESQRTVLVDAIKHFESLAERDEKDAGLQAIGASAARCLSDMVAALNCDYDRLEELREIRQDFLQAEEYTEQRDKEWQAMPEHEELAQLEEAAGDCTSREDAQQRIQEDPLSLQVRSGWRSSGEESEPEEFELLLSTGGPATRIIGELGEHNEPIRARLQAQDWFTAWTDYRGDAISQSDLLAYCNVFYFGE